MTKDHILEIITSNILEILSDIKRDEIGIENSLKELGANSIDRMEIIVKTMEDLNLKIPMVEFSNIKNINQLANLFYEKIAPGRNS